MENLFIKLFIKGIPERSVDTAKQCSNFGAALGVISQTEPGHCRSSRNPVFPTKPVRLTAYRWHKELPESSH
jgi:hypothetical protein